MLKLGAQRASIRRTMGSTLGGWSQLGAFVASTGGAAGQEAAFEGLTWLGVLIAVVIVSVIILVFIRSRTRRTRQLTEPSFSLDDLRKLRDRGAVTIAEYETLRKKLVESLCGPTEPKG